MPQHANKADGVQISRIKDITAGSFKVKEYFTISDFIFIVKVMITDHINLYGFVVSSVKLHSLDR